MQERQSGEAEIRRGQSCVEVGQPPPSRPRVVIGFERTCHVPACSALDVPGPRPNQGLCWRSGYAHARLADSRLAPQPERHGRPVRVLQDAYPRVMRDKAQDLGTTQ